MAPSPGFPWGGPTENRGITPPRYCQDGAVTSPDHPDRSSTASPHPVAAIVLLGARKDLVEARALCARLGYREIEAYTESPYADHWFEKKPT